MQALFVPKFNFLSVPVQQTLDGGGEEIGGKSRGKFSNLLLLLSCPITSQRRDKS